MLIALYVSAENLICGVAVPVEEVQWYFVEREKVRMEQSVSRLMSHCRPHTALRNFSALSVKSGRDNNGLHAILAELCEAQYASRQFFVLRRDVKALLDKTVDPDGFRRAWE
jgi:hypothetical protein